MFGNPEVQKKQVPYTFAEKIMELTASPRGVDPQTLLNVGMQMCMNWSDASKEMKRLEAQGKVQKVEGVWYTVQGKRGR